MNKKIKNGAWCLLKKDSGGAREGEIVLVEHYYIQDSSFGSGYTIKSYQSVKIKTDKSLSYKSIVLRPLSFDTYFKDIPLMRMRLMNLNNIINKKTTFKKVV
ncbi:hypothetical protein GCM10023311_01920 [Flaviramulus aquimarinus]|uniref:Uncharacterized protein n=1 Tax=Flaviramulus aquimarinus TaxID=1170456 RepID=A0ABP9ENL3_9FLAO